MVLQRYPSRAQPYGGALALPCISLTDLPVTEDIMAQRNSVLSEFGICIEACKDICVSPFKLCLLLVLLLLVIVSGEISFRLYDCTLLRLPLLQCQAPAASEENDYKGVTPQKKVLKHIVPHIFAVFVELLAAVVLIELLLRKHEKDRESEVRKDQLRHIKSYMFQASMRRLFEINFKHLEKEELRNFTKIRNAGNADKFKRAFRKLKNEVADEEKEDDGNKRFIVRVEDIKYKNDPVGKIFLEYVYAEKEVWIEFLVLATRFNFPRVVKEMTDILNCIAQAKKAASGHGMELEEFLSDPAMLRGSPVLLSKIEMIVKTGILKFIEFAEDVRESDKRMFDALMESFLVSDSQDEIAREHDVIEIPLEAHTMSVKKTGAASANITISPR
jgi:hypothetical protein